MGQKVRPDGFVTNFATQPMALNQMTLGPKGLRRPGQAYGLADVGVGMSMGMGVMVAVAVGVTGTGAPVPPGV